MPPAQPHRGVTTINHQLFMADGEQIGEISRYFTSSGECPFGHRLRSLSHY